MKVSGAGRFNSLYHNKSPCMIIYVKLIRVCVFFGGLKVVTEKRITQFLNSNIAKPAKHDYVRLA